MKKIIIGVLLLAASQPTVYAQVDPTNVQPLRPESLRERLIDTRDNIKGAVRDAKQSSTIFVKEKRDEFSNHRQEVIAEFEVRREEAKEAFRVRQEEFKKVLEQNREEVKIRIEQERSRLKDQLEKIHDENKRKIVERVSMSINDLNAKLNKHFEEVLNKFDGVLDRISSRTDKGEANGLDVAEVRTAITAAGQAIANARLVVQEQAAKTYLVTVNDENKLKLDVGQTRHNLREDLKKVKDKIDLVREALRNAVTTLAKLPKIDEINISASTSSESSSGEDVEDGS